MILICSCGKKCYFNICCYCSDIRADEYFEKFYIDNIGNLYIPNKKYNIPRNINYCSLCKCNFSINNIINGLSKEEMYLLKFPRKLEPLFDLSFKRCIDIYGNYNMKKYLNKYVTLYNIKSNLKLY